MRLCGWRRPLLTPFSQIAGPCYNLLFGDYYSHVQGRI
jgi:pyruvate/oxaloacetate carboxyltransferase